MDDNPLEEYAGMLPESERERFRTDINRFARRTLERDHAHQTVHLAWLSARQTGDRIMEAISTCPSYAEERLEYLNELSVKADAVEAGLQEIDRRDMDEVDDGD